MPQSLDSNYRNESERRGAGESRAGAEGVERQATAANTAGHLFLSLSLCDSRVMILFAVGQTVFYSPDSSLNVCQSCDENVGSSCETSS